MGRFSPGFMGIQFLLPMSKVPKAFRSSLGVGLLDSLPPTGADTPLFGYDVILGVAPHRLPDSWIGTLSVARFPFFKSLEANTHEEGFICYHLSDATVVRQTNWVMPRSVMESHCAPTLREWEC